ncbi:cytochrome bc1 complex diheme cytochrome c subunit [Demequina aurantiaca]|uniref:cytochrome bc1 complex diheme cytochrome c subunit n=1 Tax=Demequina aurantiaca TaxID=676200 RepID=UPI003D325A92
MKALANKRYHKAAPLMLVLLLLAGITGVAAVTTSSPATAATQVTEDDVVQGEKIFAANCATCHGMDAQGQEDIAPSLVGVGAASVDFQVGTGRMPMQMSGPQAQAKMPQFDQPQIDLLAAYVTSLGAGPAVPTAEQVDGSLGDPAMGMELFRINCAMCHGAGANGGALTQGKFAPSLWETTPTHIYEAMLTGPQSMPVFNDDNISSQGKTDIIAFLEQQREPSAGGLKLGALGPVSEGFWAWLIGIGLIIGATVWVGARSS